MIHSALVTLLLAPVQDPIQLLHWGDFDGDGLQDALAIGADGAPVLLRNDGLGSFVDHTESAGLDALPPLAFARWGDWNGDGREDLFVTGSAGGAWVLTVEEGVFTSTFETATDLAVLGGSWLDYDQDGRLDLYQITTDGHELWHNEGRDGLRLVPLDLPLPVVAGVAGLLFEEREAAGAAAAAGSAATARGPGSPAGAAAGPGTGQTAGAGGPGIECMPSILDQVTGNCIGVSSSPTLGMLWPLGIEWNVEPGTGYIGVGTATPLDRLSVLQGDVGIDEGHRFLVRDFGGAEVAYLGGTSGKVDLAAPGGGILRFLTDRGGALSERMILTADDGPVQLLLKEQGARLGVGTDSPTEELHVLGDGRIEGDLDATGELVVGAKLTADTIEATDTLSVGGLAAFHAPVNFKGGLEAMDGGAPLVVGDVWTTVARWHLQADPGGDGVVWITMSANGPGDVTGGGAGEFVVLVNGNPIDEFNAMGTSLEPQTFVSKSDLAIQKTYEVLARSEAGGAPMLVRDVSISFSEEPGTGGGGTLTGGGTFGQVAMWTGSSSLADSPLVVTGSDVGVGGPPVAGSDLTVHGGANGGSLVVNGPSPVEVDGQGHISAESLEVTTIDSDGLFRIETDQNLHTVEIAANGGGTVRPELYLLNAGGAGMGFGLGQYGGLEVVHRSGSGDTKLMEFHTSGEIGIGTNNPAAKLHVNTITDDIAFEAQSATPDGRAIQSVSDSTQPNLFILQTGDGDMIQCWNGQSLDPSFQVTQTGRVIATAIEVSGGGDLVEAFDATVACEPGMVVVIDPDNPGQLLPSTTPYDRKVAGAVSGAGGVKHGIKLVQDGVLEGDTLVAMTGRVMVRCSAENGAIRPGDRLTTASLAGHAMRVTDEDRAPGAVIGKAMGALDEGTGLVLVLVNLQ